MRNIEHDHQCAVSSLPLLESLETWVYLLNSCETGLVFQMINGRWSFSLTVIFSPALTVRITLESMSHSRSLNVCSGRVANGLPNLSFCFWPISAKRKSLRRYLRKVNRVRHDKLTGYAQVVRSGWLYFLGSRRSVSNSCGAPMTIF